MVCSACLPEELNGSCCLQYSEPLRMCTHQTTLSHAPRMRTSTARHLPSYALTRKYGPKSMVCCQCVGTATAEASINQSALESTASQQITPSEPTAQNSDMQQLVPRPIERALTFLESLQIRQAVVPYLARIKLNTCFQCTMPLSALLMVCAAALAGTLL